MHREVKLPGRNKVQVLLAVITVVVIAPVGLLAAYIFDPWQRGEELKGKVYSVESVEGKENEPAEVLVQLGSGSLVSVVGMECHVKLANFKREVVWRRIRAEDHVGVGDYINIREYNSRIFGRRKYRFEIYRAEVVAPSRAPYPPRQTAPVTESEPSEPLHRPAPTAADQRWFVFVGRSFLTESCD